MIPVELDPQDTIRCITALPGSVERILSRWSVCIAGGFVRSVITGEEPNDIDMFPLGTLDTTGVVADLKVDRYEQAARTENAITMVRQGRTPIQIVTRWPGKTVDRVLEGFDLTVAAAAVAMKDGVLVGRCHPRFYQDTAARRLVYTRPDRAEAEPGGTLLRLFKYARRGFNASPETLAEVVCRVVQKAGLVSAEDAEMVLRRELREVDPLPARVRLLTGAQEWTPERPGSLDDPEGNPF